MVALSCVPLLWNLLRPGFYTSHDGEWMVIRLTAFHQALREGQFPVRWLPRLNHGYGYPVTNFLYPLPFYLAEPFYVLTGNPATAVQIVMGLSAVAMAVGMYVLLSALTTSHYSLITSHKSSVFSFPSFVGALVYVYSPYVAFNLYQRGSLGELVAMGIIPWVLWAIRARWWPVASLFFAALITAHNVVALLFFPLIALLCRRDTTTNGRRPWEWRTYDWGGSLLVISLGLGLSAFFWLPAITELRFVRASTIAVSDFQNEYLSIDVAFKRSGLLATAANLGLPLFFLTDSSKGFWEMFKPLQVIQFPWRLLSVFSFTSAIIVSGILKKFSRSRLWIPIVLLSLFSISISISYLTPFSTIHHPPSYYSTNDATTTVRAEYTPIWVKELPTTRPAIPGIHYYPGWRAFLDGKEIPLRDPATTNGMMESALKSNRVTYKWSETPLRFFLNLVSAVSMVALLTWEHWRQKEQERGQRRHIRASA